VRVVTEEGEQLGIMSTRDAVKAASDRNLDLVEVAPAAKPPVCKIMDYGKFKYEQAKKDREARKKQHVVDLKEIRMSVKIGEHDFNVWFKAAESWLKEGDKVKATIRFRGREIAHPELGQKHLIKLTNLLSEVAVVERPPVIEGRNMFTILAPKQQN
jgi:translation initiation factor IF-3